MATAVLMLALVRNVLAHPPTYDELLHVLAARGMAESGTAAIAGGVYDRAQLYTWLVSKARWFVSDELVAARIPALIGAILLVAVVTAWGSRRAGPVAGAIAGGLLAISPWTIDLAVFARFYTIHALAVFGVFTSVYGCISALPQRRLAGFWLLSALPMLIVAMHLQITSVISVGAVMAGAVAGWSAGNWLTVRPWVVRYRWSLIIVAIAGLGAAFFAFQYLGYLALFLDSPVWASGSANWLNYYNRALSRDMPLFWPLLPVAAVVACVARRQLGWVLLVTGAVALAAHSLAASKAERYLYYALPFICLLLGVAASEVGSAALRWLAAQGESWRRMAPMCIAGLAGLAFAASQEGYRTARVLVGADPASVVLSYGDEPDWGQALPVLKPRLAGADVVIVSNAMKALFYLGRYDYELNVSIVAETDTRADFGIDLRTGGRAISAPQSLRRVLAEGDALVVAEDEKLGTSAGVTQASVAFLGEQCASVELPAGTGLSAWWCPRPSR